MTTIAVILILLALLGYGLKEYFQIKLGRPTSTPDSITEEIAELLADFSTSGRLIDLGSGWGSFVLGVAKRLPEWQVDGVEASPTPWFVANCRSIGGRANNIRFFIGRMEKHMLQNYDVIFVHQSTRNLNMVLPRLVRALRNDSLIIAYPNPLPRIPDPDVLISEKTDRVFVYRGTAALEFLTRREAAPDVPPPPTYDNVPPPEPEQEPVPTPADFTEPTDDNRFERAPADVSQTQFVDTAPVDLPPVNDFPEQGQTPSVTNEAAPSAAPQQRKQSDPDDHQGTLPLNYTD
jgi:hypothetical protein